MTLKPIDLYRDALQKIADDAFARMQGKKQDDWYAKAMRKLQAAENAILFPSLLRETNREK